VSTLFELPPSDLRRIRVQADDAGRAIAEWIARGKPADGLPYLASILNTQQRANSKPHPYPLDFAPWQMQTIILEDFQRNFLLVQNYGPGRLFLILEDSSNTSLQDFSAAASQSELLRRENLAVRIVQGETYEPVVVPVNAITLFTTSIAARGILLEGK
jgi:hypothetical protein